MTMELLDILLIVALGLSLAWNGILWSLRETQKAADAPGKSSTPIYFDVQAQLHQFADITHQLTEALAKARSEVPEIGDPEAGQQVERLERLEQLITLLGETMKTRMLQRSLRPVSKANLEATIKAVMPDVLELDKIDIPNAKKRLQVATRFLKQHPGASYRLVTQAIDLACERRKT